MKKMKKGRMELPLRKVPEECAFESSRAAKMAINVVEEAYKEGFFEALKYFKMVLEEVPKVMDSCVLIPPSFGLSEEESRAAARMVCSTIDAVVSLSAGSESLRKVGDKMEKAYRDAMGSAHDPED